MNFDEILKTLGTNLESVLEFALLFSTLAGFIMVGTGIIRMTSKQGVGRGGDIKAGLTSIFVGSFLVAIISTVYIVSNSFGLSASDNPEQIMSFKPNNRSGGRLMIYFAAYSLMIVGWISVIRSAFMFKSAGDPSTNQPGLLKKAIVHLSTGAISINLQAALTALAGSAGLSHVIDRLFS